MPNEADTPFVKIYVPVPERPENGGADLGKRWLVLIGEDSDSEEILEFLREMMPDVEHDADRYVGEGIKPPAFVRPPPSPAATTSGSVR